MKSQSIIMCLPSAILLCSTTASSARLFASDTSNHQSMSTGSSRASNLCEEWAAEELFPIACGENVNDAVIQKVSEDASRNRLILTVRGGNPALKSAGLRVVRRLAVEGKKIGLVFGPDRDGSLLSAEYELFARGRPAFTDHPPEFGTNYLHKVEPTITRMARIAYEANFR